MSLRASLDPIVPTSRWLSTRERTTLNRYKSAGGWVRPAAAGVRTAASPLVAGFVQRPPVFGPLHVGGIAGSFR
jgi:hypothetical protein